MERERIQAICRACGLGAVLREPEPLTGGFQHRMLGVWTTSGHYAVKLLNPHILARPQALGYYLEADALEARIESAGLPILPARCFHGPKLQCLEGQYFYVFDWYAGKALREEELRPAHCARIGETLAALHGLETLAEAVVPDADGTDWDFELECLARGNAALAAMVLPHATLLKSVQRRAQEAQAQLPPIRAICHHDLDPKNVLWQGDDFRIIDLECLDEESSPLLECWETALDWSGAGVRALDAKRLQAFLQAYTDRAGLLPCAPEVLVDCPTGRLGWLAFNLRRAQGIDCSAEEIPLGREQAEWALQQILYYEAQRERMVSLLRPWTAGSSANLLRKLYNSPVHPS